MKDEDDDFTTKELLSVGFTTIKFLLLVCVIAAIFGGAIFGAIKYCF